MIHETDEEPKENEVKCYTVAVGNAPMPWHSRKVKKSAEEALNYIQKLEGFAGFHPVPPRGTICIFKSLNQAKMAKNKMDAKGIQTSDNIRAVFVDKKHRTWRSIATTCGIQTSDNICAVFVDKKYIQEEDQ